MLGYKLVQITSDPEIVKDGVFNGSLIGKVLLILEEMPCSTEHQWKSISNSLKHFITGNTININEKQPKITIENVISTIILTNNNSIKIENGDRRYVILDISHEKVGDYKYFEELIKMTENEQGGKFFYQNCINFAKETSDWNDYPVPMTENKKKLLVSKNYENN